MSRRSRGKRRYQRRRAHALRTSARPGLVAEPTIAEAVREVIGQELQPYQERLLRTWLREPCPVCGNKEKVKRDGTMGKHSAKIDGRRIDCPGIGRKPE